MLSARSSASPRHALDNLARLYQRLLEIGFTLLPLACIAYLLWQPQLNQRLEWLTVHEALIGLATLQGGFIAWVAWRCFLHGGEPFLRWLALAFAGFTLTYLPHGLLTPLAEDHSALFLLYGPTSRLVMSICLVAAIFSYGKAPVPTAARAGFTYWRPYLAGALIIIGLVAIVAHLPWGQEVFLRLGLEAAALAVSLLALALMTRLAGRSPLMTLFASSLANFAQASLAFLLASPWNHLWWLGHVIFAIGFLALSYGVLKAYFTSRSFELVFSHEELFERLRESNSALATALAHAQEVNSELELRNRQLHMARQDFEALFALAPDGVLVVDRHGQIMKANARAQELFGGDEQRMLGLAVEELMSIQDRPAHASHRQHYHQEPDQRRMAPRPAVRAQRLDGSAFYSEISLSPLHIHGQPCTMAIVRDVTAARLAEERLRLSQQRFRDLFEHGPIGTALIRPDGHWQDVNEALCRLLHHSRSELLATSLEQLTHAEDRHTDQAQRQQLTQGKRAFYQVEKRFLRADGLVIWGVLTGSLLKDEDGQTLNFVAQIEDITERRHLELERADYAQNMARLSRRLVQVQEEERRRLAATVHDLVSPNLGAVNINLNMIANLLPPTAAEIHNRLEDTRALLGDTVSSIRSLTTDLRPAVLDFAGLGPAVDSYAQQFSARTGIAVELILAAQDRLPADQESLLFRIVQEAMTNCAKHAQAQHITIELRHNAEHGSLRIGDDGQGFSPDLNRPPSGLGLLTMRERAEFAGGRFTLESQPGQGTRISVDF